MKTIKFLTSLVTLLTSTYLFAGNWAADPDSGCKAYDVVDTDEVAIIWKGDCQDGKAQGYGVLVSKYDNDDEDTATYVGNMIAGYATGKGVLTISNGDVYQGEFARGYFEGKGKYIYYDGDSYVGEFHEDLFYGEGVYQSVGGDSYGGKWSDDHQNGEGFYKFSDGTEYWGNFVDDMFTGFGTMTTPKSAYDEDYNSTQGKWQGDVYIEKGWWEDDEFIMPCGSKANCMVKLKK